MTHIMYKQEARFRFDTLTEMQKNQFEVGVGGVSLGGGDTDYSHVE